uniref:Uncharacterized protein n=1 Tax=Gokushovirinae environmental samples TaxID=1478972 RepID=A0A2R3UAA8_9VIRU|nr:hypothetical protein [Gokushovirinae environmental samples]
MYYIGITSIRFHPKNGPVPGRDELEALALIAEVMVDITFEHYPEDVWQAG